MNGRTFPNFVLLIKSLAPSHDVALLSLSTFPTFKGQSISEVIRTGSIIICHLSKLSKAMSCSYCVMLYFWSGSRRNLKLSTLGGEKVKERSQLPNFFRNCQWQASVINIYGKKKITWIEDMNILFSSGKKQYLWTSAIYTAYTWAVGPGKSHIHHIYEQKTTLDKESTHSCPRTLSVLRNKQLPKSEAQGQLWASRNR